MKSPVLESFIGKFFQRRNHTTFTLFKKRMVKTFPNSYEASITLILKLNQEIQGRNTYTELWINIPHEHRHK